MGIGHKSNQNQNQIKYLFNPYNTEYRYKHNINTNIKSYKFTMQKDSLQEQAHYTRAYALPELAWQPENINIKLQNNYTYR